VKDLTPGLGLQQPPQVRGWCACGAIIDALDHPDLIPLAIQAHQQTPEHRAWRTAWGESIPRFEVTVDRVNEHR